MSEEQAKRGFVWFQGASVRDLYNRLTAAGPDEARLEIRLGENGKTWLRVVLPDKSIVQQIEPGTRMAALTGLLETSPEKCGDINESHNCPPDCP